VRTKKPWIEAALALALPTLLAFAVPFVGACGKENKTSDTKAAGSAAPAASFARPSDAIQGLDVKPPAPNAPTPIPPPDDVAAAAPDAKKTASGLATKVLTKGTGTDHPAATDKVKVNYTGWTTDGKMFDSSVTRGQPASFSLGGVIKGWTEGVQLMTKGQKMRFWIPGNLAYGDKPTRPGAPSGTLVFDIELIDYK
jgi:hypothetical protein